MIEHYSTTAQALRSLCKELHAIAQDRARYEAEEILLSVLDTSRSALYLHGNTPLTSEQQKRIAHILEQRCMGMPLAYAQKSGYFYSRWFHLSDATLIPRPDTEILLETILKQETQETCHFLELGTGSGIIPSILCEGRPWHGVSVDISFDALRIAQQNCPDSTQLVCMDRFSAIKDNILFDFIVSNPPYISDSDIAELDISVREYEPLLALSGGEDGLAFYRYLAENGKKYLKRSAYIYCEIGYDQKDSVIALFSDYAWGNPHVIHDIAHNPRVLVAQYI